MAEFLVLTWRELATLALLTLVGSGIACLPRGLEPVVRLALAPALGWVAASCALMTVGEVISQRLAAYTVLLPLAVLSGAFAVHEVRRRGGWSIGAPDLVRIGVVVAFIITVFNLPLALRGSLGPMGYSVSDAVGYVATAIGLESNEIGSTGWGPRWDMTAHYGWIYSLGFQHIGESMFPAATNALFGWDATTTQSANIVMLLVTGALSAFAVTRVVVRVRNVDVLAGLLVAGPVFYTLYINSSMATIGGQAIVLPFILFATRVIARRDWRDVLVLGLLAAGLQTLFASIVPAAVLGGVLVLGGLAVLSWQSGRLTCRGVRTAAVTLGLVLLLGVVLSPISFERDVQLWRSLAAGDDYIPNLPYYVPIQVLPGWLLGTREFFALATPTDASAGEWLRGDVIPVLLIVLIAITLWRQPRLLPYAALFAGAAAIALYSAEQRGCAYCVERNLGAVAPIVVLMLAATVGVLWQTRGRWTRPLAVGVALLIVGSTALASSESARRGMTAFVVSQDAREVTDAARGRVGAILMEGFDFTDDSPSEMPAMYHLLNLRTDGMIAIDAEHNVHAGLTYLPLGDRHPAELWVPDYRWVLTRAPSIRTDRRTVARHGPYALQQRISYFDVSVVTGVFIDRQKRDDTGDAYIQPQFGPLEFWVAALRRDRVWLHFEVEGPRAADTPIPSGVTSEGRSPDGLRLCLPVPGREPQRRVAVPLAVAASPLLPVGSRFETSAKPEPGPKLTGMRATTEPCRREPRTPD